jgi:curved DNA-binding protein CbpA
MKTSNYYELLGVPETANAQEIKSAYKKKALLFHPDKNHAPEAEEIFKQINEAYQILSDPIARANYDYMLTQPEIKSSRAEYNPPYQPPRPERKQPFTTKKSIIYGLVFGLFALLAAAGIYFGSAMTDYAARHYWEEAQTLYSEKDYYNALSALGKTLQNKEENLDAQLLMAKIYAENLSKYDYAKSHLQFVFEKSAQSELLQEVGNIARANEDFDFALQVFLKIHEKKADDFGANLSLAELYLNEFSKPEKAMPYYQKLADISPQAPVGELGKAVCLRLLKDYSGFENSLMIVKNLAPQDPYFRYFYGLLLLEVKNLPEEARPHFEYAFRAGVEEAGMFLK